jgi:hypothetical protein
LSRGGPHREAADGTVERRALAAVAPEGVGRTPGEFDDDRQSYVFHPASHLTMFGGGGGAWDVDGTEGWDDTDEPNAIDCRTSVRREG